MAAQTDFEKRLLSGSTDGKGIKLSATSTPGTLLHTAVAGTSALDEIWLWIINSHTENVIVTVEFGGTSSPDNTIQFTVLRQDGLKLILPGLLLQNGQAVRAFASTANVLVAYGHINNMV
jgi:hypothetical protein